MSVGVRSALVTGASGFIGSALVRRLVESGVPTRCVVRRRTPMLSRLAASGAIDLVDVAELNGSELRRALGGRRADVVFHLASYGVRPDERDPEQMHLGNVGLVAALLSAVDEPRCFVHAGTCSEYARAEAGVLIPESHPMLPESLYGAAKAGAALFGAACARRRGLPFLWLRLFGVFGVGEASHRLVPHVIAHLRRGERPSLTGGTQERDLTYVDDVADALVLAAGSTSLDAYVPYNVCSGVPVTIRAVAEAVARKMGRPDSALGLGDLPYRSDEAMWVVGDPTRFRAATGWAPRVGLEEGIGRMIEADGIG